MSTEESNTPSRSPQPRPKFLGRSLDAIMNPSEDLFPTSGRHGPERVTLVYELPDGEEGEAVIERLGAAGLTDALIGMGEHGQVALQFERHGRGLLVAIAESIERVTQAHPKLLLRSVR